jgi:hypothetical protein
MFLSKWGGSVADSRTAFNWHVAVGELRIVKFDDYHTGPRLRFLQTSVSSLPGYIHIF